ncbi:MAG: GntR family transcriptional regulator [Firmicutes bacterium]|nr:GntR family transcriptional regulator [Bacillota bacterium]
MAMDWIEGKAIYLQIMDHISSEIAAGILKPGQKVKSVREYASEMGVNPNTVQRALHELEREGILSSHRNTGRFVTDSSNTIEKMREEQAEEAVQECCSKLMELGFDLKEAEKFFREKVGEVYSLQARRIG